MGNFLKSMGKIFSPLARPIEKMFRGGSNPADYARQFMNNVPQYGKDAYNPYIQQGQEAFGNLSPEYLEMLKNPQAMLNKDMAGYEESDLYKYMAPRLEQGMENTAAHGGYAGTMGDRLNHADLVRGLMSQDIGSYLDRVKGYRGTGMQGMESAVGRGFQGAGSLADYLGTADVNRSNLEFAGKSQQSMNKSSFMNALMKAMAAAAGGKAGAGTTDDTTDPTGAATSGINLRKIQTTLPPGAKAPMSRNIYGNRSGGGY